MRILARLGTPGTASGRVIKAASTVDFGREFDVASGNYQSRSDPVRHSLAGSVFVIPGALPDEALPAILLRSREAGTAPSAVVSLAWDASLARALALAKVPAVSHAQPEAFQEGDRVSLDGSEGWIELDEVNATEVVTSVLRSDVGNILLLKRSEKVGSFRGRWAGVSGFMESLTPLEQAYVEIEEEVGLRRSEVHLAREGERVYARDGARMFVVYPFLFAATRTTIQIDWEHTEYRWVPPTEMTSFETVPGLDRVFRALGLGQP